MKNIIEIENEQTAENSRMNYRILGEGAYAPNDDLHSRLNNNDLVIGGSGSGKTGGYVIPNLRCPYGSFIVTDTKGQLYRMLASDLRRQGYKVRLLDFVNPEHSQGYNPLHYIRPSQMKADGNRYNYKDIVSLAALMVPKISGDREPFWQDSARTVMTFLLTFAMEALPPNERYLPGVTALYRCLSNEKSLNRIRLWCEMHPDSFAAAKFGMFSSVITSEKTWGCIEQFVAEALDIYNLPEVSPIFSANREYVNLHDIGREKTAVFLNVSDTDRYADTMVSLFYAQAMQVLCNDAGRSPDGRLPVPVRFIMDDFGSSVYIEDFDRLISIIRSRNISASVILQSLPQLETRYNYAQSQTIIANCDHILYLGGQDLDTAVYIGSRINRTADKVLQLPDDKAYLMVRGKQGQMVDKVTPYGDRAKFQCREALNAPMTVYEP